MKNQYALFILLSSLLLGAALKAQGEQITHYDVTIEVNRDASLTVTEEIRVMAGGESIKRGIVRKLPIEYGVREDSYKILDIRRDGRAEPYRVKRKEGSLSIYIGKKRVKIPPGAYTYTIRYRALWGVRCHREFEEVYWNAIGSDWAFPIDTALCRLILPKGTKATQAFAYTGRYGSRDLGEAKGQGEFNRITFTPNRPLMPEEGLTIAARMDKKLISMAIYTYLIKKPSVAKLALQARIEGFWMYLSTAEKDRLEWSAPLEKTPTVFEAMLPFAFAAGVANRWTELFRDTLAGAGYRAQWGDGFDAFDHNDFADDFCGTMQNACISASSYGSDGGGAVGGGGGGGGGDGW